MNQSDDLTLSKDWAKLLAEEFSEWTDWDSSFDEFKPLKCQCGAEKAEIAWHASYCPKYKDPMGG